MNERVKYNRGREIESKKIKIKDMDEKNALGYNNVEFFCREIFNLSNYLSLLIKV